MASSQGPTLTFPDGSCMALAQLPRMKVTGEDGL